MHARRALPRNENDIRLLFGRDSSEELSGPEAFIFPKEFNFGVTESAGFIPKNGMD